jgi:hypothetical protein
MMDVFGKEVPEGNATKYPGPAALVTVKFNETAWAVSGMLHCPVIVKSRVELATRDGGPYAPENPDPERVSATRHGGTATKKNSGDTVAARAFDIESAASVGAAVSPVLA